MAEVLSSKMVAEMLDTEPRTLRRFLRDDVTYRNAGSGGRYEFTARDLPTLKKRFVGWQAGVEARRAKRDTSGLQKKTKANEPEPDVIDIPKCTPQLRAKEREQIARLEDRLKQCGLHISQLKVRVTWNPVEGESVAS